MKKTIVPFSSVSRVLVRQVKSPPGDVTLSEAGQEGKLNVPKVLSAFYTFEDKQDLKPKMRIAQASKGDFQTILLDVAQRLQEWQNPA